MTKSAFGNLLFGQIPVELDHFYIHGHDSDGDIR